MTGRRPPGGWPGPGIQRQAVDVATQRQPDPIVPLTPPADRVPPLPAGLGLSSAEAAARLEQFGRNVIAEKRRRPIVVQILLRFRNPLIILLLSASGIAGLTGDMRSFVVTLVMVALSVGLDFFQEHRAGRAAERLRQSAVTRTCALRDGELREIPAPEIVPGDVIALGAGDLVPADGTLLHARDLFVNQALLTGEPYPVEKRAAPAPIAVAVPAADQPDGVLMGSSVTSGEGRMLVAGTGPRTMLGQIGASLQRDPPPSAFEKGTRAFGFLIVRLALIMVLFVILVDAWRGRPWLESFLFAVALAVGLTPELLPMVVSVTLSRGAIRLGRKKVLVKRLAAIHDLGSMDVLCTDKTGTLTEARIRLQDHVDAFGRPSARVLAMAHLNSRFQSGLKSPLDEAVENASAAIDGGPLGATDWRKLDEVPFDFQRRRGATLVGSAAQPCLLIVKGAFENVLAVATQVDDGAGAPRPLDLALRAQILARCEALGDEGLRVLGIGWRTFDDGRHSVEKTDERELVLAGLLVFQDPPKQSARAALQGLRERGVAIKLLTGDDGRVARHVCRELNLNVEGALAGADLALLDDAALDAVVERTTLFCRVTPAQKDRIILSLKRRKHTVGFIGDGINDASALHSADVGISVDTAVDVAKEAADLILMEQDLGVLHQGVLEGRRTLGNIIKYILMGTSSNFGNMFSMAGASVFLPFLPMRPLQILVNNFLYDLSEIPIPTDRVEEEFVSRPRRWDMSFIRRFMLVIGPVSSAFDFLTFFVLRRVLHAPEALFQTGWFVESLATQALVIFVIRTRGNPLRNRPSPALALTSLAVVAAGVALPLSPLGPTLGFVSPPAIFYVALAAIVAVYLVAVQTVKSWFYRHHAGSRSSGGEA